MKTYFFDVIQRIKRFSMTFDVESLLCNRTWNMFSDTDETEVYVFQDDGSVFITKHGVGEQAKWNWLSENNSLIINRDGHVLLLHPEYIDKSILALSLDGTNNLAFLIDQSNKSALAAKSQDQLEQYFIEKEQRLIKAEKDNIKIEEQDNRAEIENEEQIGIDAQKLSDKKLRGYPFFCLVGALLLYFCIPAVIAVLTYNPPGSESYDFYKERSNFISTTIFQTVVIVLILVLQNPEQKMWHRMKIRNWIRNHPNDPRNKHLKLEIEE